MVTVQRKIHNSMAILCNRGLVGIPVKNGILADKCVFGLTFIKIIGGINDFTFKSKQKLKRA